MGKADQFIEAESPGTPLDRVNGAEDGVHRLDSLVAAAVEQRAQPFAQAFEQILAFLEEADAQRVEGVRPRHRQSPRTRRMIDTSASSSKGLTIQPVAPLRRARSFSSGPFSVVRTRTGVDA